MRIQHNINALNANRNLTWNNNAVGKSLEKLSSGYRINRAGDDAAGLAISEKMRAQISCLTQAETNCNDGVSLIQTAEGALAEVHDMLNRMVELSEQSANGTYDNTVDRKNLQAEVDQLKEEIDRISKATNFNGINLLDGSLGATAGSDGVNADGQIENKLLIDSNTGLAATFKEEVKQGFKFNANTDKLAAGKSATIKFTVDGDDYEITLNAPVDATVGKIADALNGNDNTLVANANDDKTREALKVFQENFEASDAGIFAKQAGVTDAKIVSVTETGTALVVTGSGMVEGSDPVYQIDTTALTGNGTLTIGDKKVNITAVTTDATTKLASVEKALKEAGVDYEVDADGKTINIKEATTQTAQAGVGISSSNKEVALESVAATKSKYTTEIGAVTAGKNVFTLNYIDANGEAQSKELNYTATTTADAASAIKAAIESDADLKNLFTVTIDNGASATANDTLVIESTFAGASAAKVTSTTSSDAAFSQTVTTVEGQDAGTNIRLTGKNGAAAATNFEIGNTITVNGKTYEFTDGNSPVKEGNTAIVLATDLENSYKNLQAALKNDGIESTYDATKQALRIANTAAEKKAVENGGLTLQIGDTADDFNKLTVAVDAMDTENLDIKDVDISTQDGASIAIEKVKAAINKVSSTRGTLGAMQNRLEHTINNLSVTNENITNAESRIRDTDMAKEMMAYTSKNILSQAAQSMLAQANQQPQQVLSLLQ